MTKEEILNLKENAAELGLHILQDSELNNLLGKAADDVTRNIAQKLEESIFQASGVKKRQNEKYFAYAERVLKELVSVKEEYENIKGKDWDKVLQTKEQQLESLRKEIAEKEQQHKHQLAEFEQRAFQKQVKSYFEQAVSEYKNRPKKIEGMDVTDLIEVKSKVAFTELMEKYTPVQDEETGDFVGFVEAGTAPEKAFVLREPKSGRVLGFVDLLEPFLKDLVTPATARVLQGRGLKEEKAAIINDLMYKDKESIVDALKARGYNLLEAEGQNLLHQIFVQKRKMGIQ